MYFFFHFLLRDGNKLYNELFIAVTRINKLDISLTVRHELIIY